jgi:tRNA modification GTPase
MTTDDTVTAIATAPGEAGISIVRLSGPDSYRIADDVFRCRGPRPSQRAPFTFVHGHVMDGDTPLDEVLLLLMRAPRSYTGEDAVEFQGHGGPVSAKRILRRLLDAGARLAEPGEFTKRAFLNGRMDLLQAEAVLDLIHARSERAAAVAMDQLEGRLTSYFNSIYGRLLSIATDIEASLDFPEDDIALNVVRECFTRLSNCKTGIDSLLSTWDSGHLLRDGASIVISGKPNVGKSSIMNALLGSDRAIVSHIPGTTRDVIEEGFVMDGVFLRLIDTAGLRNSDDEIEREGIRRARRQIERADFVLYVVDASSPISEQEMDEIAALDRSRTIIVMNKADLVTGVVINSVFANSICTSATTGTGISDLRTGIQAMLEAVIGTRAPPHQIVISERHRRLLMEAKNAVEEAIGLSKQDAESSAVLMAECVRSAMEQLGMATGRVYHDELLNSIFSRFCIGK